MTTIDEDVREHLSKLTIPVEVAGRILGLGRNSAYAAAKNGQLPTIRIGGRILVPTVALRRMLGLEEKETA